MLGIPEDNAESEMVSESGESTSHLSQAPGSESSLKTAGTMAADDGSGDDSEDEPVIRTKTHRKKRQQIVDDSDSEEDEKRDDEPEKKSQSDSDKEDQDSDDSNEEEIKEKTPLSQKKKKIIINSDSDSDTEFEKVDKNQTTRYNLDSGPESETEEKKSPEKTGASGGDSNKGNESSSSSDSESEGETPKDTPAWGTDSSDDEPGELSEALRKKLAKGAAKKGGKGSGEGGSGVRKGQSRKSKTDAMTEIHAETQRLIRESDIRLPYHKPTPLGLSAILERTKKKQESLKELKGAWKTPPSIHQSLVTTPSLNKTKPEASSASPLLAKPTSDPSPNPSTSTDHPTPSTMMEEEGEEGDTLPDITNTPLSERLQAKNLSTDAIKSDSIPLTLDETLKSAEPKPEQDSGFISTSCHTSEEENSSENTPKNKEISLTDDINSEKVNSVEKTPVTGQKVGTLRQTALTPRLAALGFDKGKPRLSGGPDAFIDLDDDEVPKNTPKPGVRDLMDRLMKHSANRKKKAAQDVEISTVEKVKTGKDGEELQLKKFVVHLDGAEAPADPKLNKPGAKLLNLKESLAEKMKAKREEARKARCEMFALDNEEGFEEEEAELTDQSDTDGEEEEEEIEEEEELEEEMDAQEYTTEEREMKNNPFVNDEAEDEDGDLEDEDGESNLHLQFNDDEETATADEAPRKPATDYLKVALQKSNTLQLFDDDAISASPTLSQSTNKESIELSDRPFEQLSGETVKLSQKSEQRNELDDVLNDADDVKNDTEDDVSMMNLDDTENEDTSPKLENPNLSLLRDADSSYDTLIPAGQGTIRKHRRKNCTTPDLFTPSTKSSVATNSTYSKGLGKMPLPIEDSQDLLGSPSRGSQAESTPRDKPMTSFNFHLNDSTTYSHLLDEDGFLKDEGSAKKPARRQLLLEGESDGEDEAELLGLCSGKFSLSQGADDKTKNFAGIGGIDRLLDDTQSTGDDILGLCSGQFTSTHKPPSSSDVTTALGLPSTQPTQTNMSELLGLCSGKFTGDDQSQSQSSSKFTADDQSINSSPKNIIKKKKKRRVITDDDDDDEFEVLEAKETDPAMESETLDSDEEPVSKIESDSSDEEDEEMMMAKKLQKKKKKMSMKNFVDAEAELSGSEYDSDENYDIDEKDDVMERCSGDEEEFDNDQLQEQVGRVHLKNMIDEDKRDIRLMQEMYLPDGDLYSEGGGRMRRFRWKNIDDDSQQDMFQASDDEAEEDNLEAQKWRLERHEREKFLSEQKEAEEAAGEEPEAPTIKLGKVIYKSKKDAAARKVLGTANTDNTKTGPSLFKVPKASHGSFLNRGRDSLLKIAEFTKPVSNNVGGARSSRGFVFAALSEEEKKSETENANKKPGLRRAMSTPASNQPASKKPRLEKSATVPQKTNSIFKHL